jgi:hypothetical protein
MRSWLLLRARRLEQLLHRTHRKADRRALGRRRSAGARLDATAPRRHHQGASDALPVPARHRPARHPGVRVRSAAASEPAVVRRATGSSPAVPSTRCSTASRSAAATASITSAATVGRTSCASDGPVPTSCRRTCAASVAAFPRASPLPAGGHAAPSGLAVVRCSLRTRQGQPDQDQSHGDRAASQRTHARHDAHDSASAGGWATAKRWRRTPAHAPIGLHARSSRRPGDDLRNPCIRLRSACARSRTAAGTRTQGT